MNIQKSLLSEFLKLISLQGDAENKEIVLNFEKNEIKTYLVNLNKTLATIGTLKLKDNLNKHSIGISDLNSFKRLLNNFKDNINITIENNKLILKENNLEINYTIREPQTILTTLEQDKFEYLQQQISKQSFLLTSNITSRIIDFVNNFKSNEITLQAEKDLLTIILEDNEKSLKSTFKLEDVEGVNINFKLRFSQIFIDILNTIKDYDVRVYAETEKIAYLLLGIEGIDIGYFVAPLKND